MRKICTLLFSLVMCFLFANSVFAVGFSQLVKIGDISTDPLSGFHFDGDYHNKGIRYVSKYHKKPGDYGYEKGTVIWGKGKDALDCDYDFAQNSAKMSDHERTGKHVFLFGTSTSLNRQACDFFDYGYEIYTLKRDERTFYVIKSYGSIASATNYIFLGQQNDGKFVKYIDCDDINERYFNRHKNEYGTTAGKYALYYNEIWIDRDAIVINYQLTAPREAYKDAGKFILRWDEAAQWFSIEQVVY